MENPTDCAARLKIAFGELMKRGLASSQKEIAEKMSASKPNVSSAFKGDARVLTDRFLTRFNAAFGGIFSPEWLMFGTGEMLASVNQVSHGDYSPNVNGSGNSVNSTAAVDRFLEELSAQRKLAERTLDLLEKRDSQLDRLITIIENQAK